MVDAWLTSYAERGLKTNTANTAFRIFQVMMEQAVKKRIIKFNPCAAVSPLAVSDAKKIKILTEAEFKKMFPKDWSAVWAEPMHYIFNKLAALTGMRHGELLGLRGEFVSDMEIKVCAQYNQFGYTDTKNHKSRTVPITPELRGDLQTLIEMNGQGFLFSSDGGKKPIRRDEVAANYHAALAAPGGFSLAFSIKGRFRAKPRGSFLLCTTHYFMGARRYAAPGFPWFRYRSIPYGDATRHSNPIALRGCVRVMDNINIKKVQSVTGHLSDKMTDRYTQIDSGDLSEVRSLQEKLLAPGPEPECQATEQKT
jgi:site-specific recombinase XerD